MANILGTYTNGNYTVTILEDGTKIRETEDSRFVPVFSENCDVTITTECDGGCQFCYMGCTKNGHHADLFKYDFLKTLHPYTELALNANDLTHPQLQDFLEYLKEKKVITNLTINQKHFMIEENRKKLHSWTNDKLIYGLGVSLVKPDDEFIEAVHEFPNAVVHVINGIWNNFDVVKMMGKNLKVLILGYKELNRGINYKENNKEDIKNNQTFLYTVLDKIIPYFKVISFDNLALEQLDVKRLLTEEEWDEFFMGDDGTSTFYIDMVNGFFAKNSLSPIHYPIMDNIDNMFYKITQEETKNAVG